MESVGGVSTDKFWIVSSGCRRKVNLSFFMLSYYRLFPKKFLSTIHTSHHILLSDWFFSFLAVELLYHVCLSNQQCLLLLLDFQLQSTLPLSCIDRFSYKQELCIMLKETSA